MTTGDDVAGDLRNMGLLDEALEELRATGVLNVENWQARHADSSGLLLARLQLMQGLETALGAVRKSAVAELTAAEADAEPELTAMLAPAQLPDELGRLGAHRVLKILGAGAMGIVFLAEDLHLQRLVALKAMRPALAASPAARQRFLREARLAAKAQHDHIVTIYQVGEDRSVPFLAMELLRGESLDALSRRAGRLPVADVIRIGRETAEGLAFAHADGLIHRDIKPANIWLEDRRASGLACPDADGRSEAASPTSVRVKILDFGLARAVAGDAHLTQAGILVGTPSYMAPEQLTGHPVDARCDLFSLGCVLYRLCTGAAPFPGADVMAIIAAMAVHRPPQPNQINPDVPQALADLVMSMLEKDPEHRPASAGIVVARLEAIDGERRSVQESQPAHATVPAVRRPRWLFGAGAAGLLAASFLLGSLFTFHTRDGTLVVHVMEPDVQIFVDESRQVTIDSKKMGKVQLVPGAHQLTVKRGQEELVTTAFTLRSGGETVIIARWEAKRAQPPPPETKRAAATDDAWIRLVGSLRPELQVEVVKDELKKRNPGFDGAVDHRHKDGVVTHLQFTTDHVADIAPLRALTGLKLLWCLGKDNGQLADLTPLKGMAIEVLQFSRNQVKDLTPLHGMPALRVLHCAFNPIADLAPLAGLPLRELHCNGTQVSDLTPLKGLPLKLLHCAVTPVRDLAPLKDLPLEWLGCCDVALRDRTLLRDLPLRGLECDFIFERDAALLRASKTLETINGLPVAEFWKKADAERAGLNRM